MGRKNRRRKIEYRDRLGFNPKKYIKQSAEKADAVSYRKPEQTVRTPYRGEVWFAELGYHFGTSVQDGCRPVLIISNDTGNEHARTLVVLPITSKKKKYDLPIHVGLNQEDLTKTDPDRPLGESMILAEQITTIAKSSLRNYIGKVESAEKLAEIDRAVKTQLGMALGYI